MLLPVSAGRYQIALRGAIAAPGGVARSADSGTRGLMAQSRGRLVPQKGWATAGGSSRLGYT